jgi:hypothetical protein
MSTRTIRKLPDSAIPRMRENTQFLTMPGVKNENIINAIRLMNARFELRTSYLRNEKIKTALAIGVLDHAIEYVLTGKIKLRAGLYTALLFTEQ